PPRITPSPYPTLFRSLHRSATAIRIRGIDAEVRRRAEVAQEVAHQRKVRAAESRGAGQRTVPEDALVGPVDGDDLEARGRDRTRSEEHTSELQSRVDL